MAEPHDTSFSLAGITWPNLRASDRARLGAEPGPVEVNDASWDALDAANPVAWSPPSRGVTGRAVVTVILIVTVAYFIARVLT